jgi:hypothetical protein
MDPGLVRPVASTKTNFGLPALQNDAIAATLERACLMPGERVLTCEECGKDYYVTLWRFEGASCRETSS